MEKFNLSFLPKFEKEYIDFSNIEIDKHIKNIILKLNTNPNIMTYHCCEGWHKDWSILWPGQESKYYCAYVVLTISDDIIEKFKSIFNSELIKKLNLMINYDELGITITCTNKKYKKRFWNFIYKNLCYID